MSLPTLVVQIDWSANDVFTDANEDVTADVQAIRWTMGRRAPFGMAQPSSCELVLANDDKLYSPENASGALFGNLKPGRRVRIRTTAPGGTKVQFIGKIDDIIIEPTLDRRLARINCLDDLAFAARETGEIYTRLTADTPLLEPDGNGEGPFTGEAIDAVLDEIGWATGGGNRAVDVGISEMGVYWASGIDGLAAIAQLTSEEAGFPYVDKAEGLPGFPTFIFEDRAHRYKGDHLISQATYTDDPTGALRYENFDPYGLGIQNVFNRARATARPRKTAGTLQLGKLGSTPALAPGESRVFIITWNNPAAAVSGTTMVANSKVDGTGDDLTSQVTKVNGTAKATRWPITLTNDTDPLRTAFITTLQGGLAVREQDGQGTELEVEDTASQGDYGVRRFGAEPQYIGKTLNARDWAGYVVGAFKDPIPMLRLSFSPYDDTILTEMLSRKLSDRVTVVNGELGLDDDFFIEKIDYQWVAGREPFLTTMTLSKVEKDDQFWILGDAVLGKLGETTKLFG